MKDVTAVMEAVQKFERSCNITTPLLDESRPDDLLEYLEKRLEEIKSSSTADIHPKVVKKIMKKLRDLVRTCNILVSTLPWIQ